MDASAKTSSATAEAFNMTAATASFTICSMGMMVFNKLAIKSFPLPCTLVATQMLFTVLFMCTICYRSIHIGSWRDVGRWSRVVPFFVGMLLTSMFALKGAPMSLVITFRSLTPFVTLGVERFYPNPSQPGVYSCLALFGTVLGAMFYSFDLDRNDKSSYWAIFWVLLNSIIACIERLLQRLMLAKDQDPVDISKSGVSLLNNLLGLPPLVAMAFVMGETSRIQSTISGMVHLDMLWVLFSCFVGVGISFSAIWAQSLISATSMLVLTNSNKFVIILLEVYVLHGKHLLTNIQIYGASATIMASVMYARLREWEESMKKLAKEEHLGETQPLVAAKDKV